MGLSYAAVIASYTAALRAMTLDPVDAVRSE